MSNKRRVRPKARHHKTGEPSKYDSLISRDVFSDETQEEFFKRLSSQSNDEVSHHIEYVEEMAKSVLRKAGYPDNLGPVKSLSLFDRSDINPEVAITNAYFESFLLREVPKTGYRTERNRK